MGRTGSWKGDTAPLLRALDRGRRVEDDVREAVLIASAAYEAAAADNSPRPPTRISPPLPPPERRKMGSSELAGGGSSDPGACFLVNAGSLVFAARVEKSSSRWAFFGVAGSATGLRFSEVPVALPCGGGKKPRLVLS